LWIIFIVAIIGFFVVKAVNNSNRKTEKRMISATLEVMIGPISPKLVLDAAIPLKPKLSITGAYADSLARHVKIYLKQNPDEAAKYINLIKGEDSPEELLGYEMMLEHSQFIRTIILRSVLNIKRMGNWEFCSAIDESRLIRLVHAQETNPEAYFLMDGENNTILQGKDIEYLED
jgi:hypothetical protein